MISSNPEELGAAVLAEMNRAENPRTRQLLSAAVRHLHAFAAKCSSPKPEFQQACARDRQARAVDDAVAQRSGAVRGSLGLSALVCLLNNGGRGEDRTTANLLGPFWREDSPPIVERRFDRALTHPRRADLRHRLGARPARPAGARRRGGRVAQPRPRATTKTRTRSRPT